MTNLFEDSMPELPAGQVTRLVDEALAEDTARGDITTELLIDPTLSRQAIIRAHAEGVLAGAIVAAITFQRADSTTLVSLPIRDGHRVSPGDIVLTALGPARSLLIAERTALNFLSYLSGIATITARYVSEVSTTGAIISDTRKTRPTLRVLEKYAVRVGGGRNHRFDLSTHILIKDNHLAILKSQGYELADIIATAYRKRPLGTPIEVEVSSLEDALTAASRGADIVMLDNMSPSEMKEVVQMLKGRVVLEASGGITLSTAREVAETGVDVISVGALTHSAPALDFSLEIAPA